MTTLGEHLAGPPPGHIPGPRCGVGQLLESLPTTESEALTNALERDQWTVTQLSALLRANGHDIGVGAVSRHKRGICKCVPA